MNIMSNYIKMSNCRQRKIFCCYHILFVILNIQRIKCGSCSVKILFLIRYLRQIFFLITQFIPKMPYLFQSSLSWAAQGYSRWLHFQNSNLIFSSHCLWFLYRIARWFQNATLCKFYFARVVCITLNKVNCFRGVVYEKDVFQPFVY